MVLLSSSDEEGSCFITTANLDGETNLKVWYTDTLLFYMYGSRRVLDNCRAIVVYDEVALC